MRTEHYENYHALLGVLDTTETMLQIWSRPNTFFKSDSATELRLLKIRLREHLGRITETLEKNRLTW